MEEHRRYHAKIKEELPAFGFEVPLFTSDSSGLFNGDAIEGALPTAYGENNVPNLKKAVDEYHNGKDSYIVAGFYTGWLAHRGKPHLHITAFYM